VERKRTRVELCLYAIIHISRRHCPWIQERKAHAYDREKMAVHLPGKEKEGTLVDQTRINSRWRWGILLGASFPD
jgi:hypothetical protein